MGIGIFSPVSPSSGITPSVGIFSAPNAGHRKASSWFSPARSTGRRAERRHTAVTFNRDGSVTFHRSKGSRGRGGLGAGRGRTPRGR